MHTIYRRRRQETEDQIQHHAKEYLCIGTGDTGTSSGGKSKRQPTTILCNSILSDMKRHDRLHGRRTKHSDNDKASDYRNFFERKPSRRRKDTHDPTPSRMDVENLRQLTTISHAIVTDRDDM